MYERINHKPAYLYTCVKFERDADGQPLAGCGWSGKFYFDAPYSKVNDQWVGGLPEVCPRCRFSYQPGYNGGAPRPHGNWLKQHALTEPAEYESRQDRLNALLAG